MSSTLETRGATFTGRGAYRECDVRCRGGAWTRWSFATFPHQRLMCASVGVQWRGLGTMPICHCQGFCRSSVFFRGAFAGGFGGTG